MDNDRSCNNCENQETCYKLNATKTACSDWEKRLNESIENLVNRNKELEKENKKLEEARNWYFEHTVNKAVTPEMLHKILRQDYIPKSVIKEKIEELENNKIYLSKFKDWTEKDYTNKDIIDNCIDVLQELLGEEK